MQEKDSNSTDKGQQPFITKVGSHTFDFHVGVPKITVGEKPLEVVKVVDDGCCSFKIAVEPVGPIAGHAACHSSLVTECQPLCSAAILFITLGTCELCVMALVSRMTLAVAVSCLQKC